MSALFRVIRQARNNGVMRGLQCRGGGFIVFLSRHNSCITHVYSLWLIMLASEYQFQHIN